MATSVLAAARPRPRPAQLARIAAGVEVYGIVHWGLNTYADREWGLGDEDPALLDPPRLDADQIVGACKAGGLQGLIVVAKHHDGFCLWPTKTTEHNISKSPFRNGKGDYVKEMEQACRRQGLKFGVYVSPWDRNNAAYGTGKYVTDVFRQQIRELLSGDYGEIFEMWFDNANGGDGYYGGAREKRTIPSGYYGFGDVFRLVRKLQPTVCIFNEDDAADFRWPGNEMGILDEDCRATGRHFDMSRYDDYMKWTAKGVQEGVSFHPPEADFPLRPGWFYHAAEDGRAKSAAFLMQRYLNVVGNGGAMNIGIAPNRDGVLCEEDVRVLKEFGELRRQFFSRPVSSGMCNVVVLREDVSQGELVDGWTVSEEGVPDPVVARGASIGIKRIRLLERNCRAENLRLKATSETGLQPRLLPVQCFAADEALVRRIAEATDGTGETKTARLMTASRKTACAGETSALWMKYLTPPAAYTNFARRVVKTAEYAFPNFTVECYKQANGPDSVQRVMMAIPKGIKGKVPCVVAPFYFPEAMLGFDPATGTVESDLAPDGTNLTYCSEIAYLSDLAKRGYVALSAEAYHLTYRNHEEPWWSCSLPPLDFLWSHPWRRVGEALDEDWPQWTGIGKLVFDTRLLVDLAAADPRVDANRIGIIGHSLGGKMSFYTGCLDSRVKAIVASDFGIGWTQTNWSDVWYWGERVKEMRATGTSHADLLTLSGAKPFCLIAGKYDDADSGAIMRSAKGYEDHPERLKLIHHGTGHRPPRWATEEGYRFLDEFLK